MSTAMHPLTIEVLRLACDLDALDEMTDDGGVVAEDFIAVVGRFNRLRVAGVSFDPAFVEWMEGMQRQLINGENDVDLDRFDDRLEPIEDQIAEQWA